MLCRDCEERLSAFERSAAERLFIPYVQGQGRVRFEYDEWLLKFAITLSWRCLSVSDGSGLLKHPQNAPAIDEAKTEFKDYLLERGPAPTRYRHNLFFLTAGGQSGRELPEGMTSYFLRAVDATPVYGEKKAATFVKFPGMFFWTSISPPDPGGWRGTKIARHGTMLAKNQEIEEPGTGDFLNERIKRVTGMFDKGLSQRQQDRIAETIRKNPERTATSKSMEALSDDRRIALENLEKRRNKHASRPFGV